MHSLNVFCLECNSYSWNKFLFIGIVKSEANSSFQYFAGETFLTVKDESFQPVFHISAEVLSQCDDDFFCAYDAAVTKDIDFAMHTLASVEEAVRVEKLSGLSK